MKPTLVTPPAESPVLLSELKDAARVDGTDSDAVLQSYLDAAVSHFDGYSGLLGRCIVTQTWQQGFRCWLPRLRLPFPDVSSVTVKYQDADGAEQTVAPALYELSNRGHLGAEVIFKDAFTAPALDDDTEAPVVVELTAGYGTAADVPEDIKVAIKALARHWYDGQEGEPPQLVLIDKRRFRA